MTIALLSVAWAASAQDSSVVHQPRSVLDTPMYSRVVVLSQDYPWPGPVVPLDPNHQGMLNLGVYTQADADAITADAIADVLAKYGVDFSDSNSNVLMDASTGIRLLPGLAVFLPIIIGSNEEFFVVSDTKHPERDNTRKWFSVEVGHIILFTGSGTFASGTNAGAQHQANDLFTFGEANYFKKGADWTNPANREVVKFRTSNLSKQSINQWGNPHYNIALDAFDEDGNRGLFLAATAVLKEPVVTGTNVLKERAVLTWIYPRGAREH
jgi:hypothetical protein